MCSANVGEYAYGGTYDALQGIHLTHFRDAGLKDAQLRLFVQHPHGQGYSRL